MILEVDGSLTNPMAAGAVAIWAIILSGVALVAALRICPPLVRLGAFILVSVMSTATRHAQHLIGSILYSVVDWRVVDVGFWYGPPTWIAPLVAGIVGFAAWIIRRRGSLPPPPANKPLQPTSGAKGLS